MAKKPNIRFAGFEDDWEQRKVGDYLTESREIGNKGDVARKMTVKLWGKGVYEKLEAGSTNTQYFIRHANQFIYSKLDFLNCAFGVVPEELESLETTADVPAFDCVYMNPYFMFYRAIQPSFYIQNGIIANGSRKAKRIHTDTFLEMPISVPCLTEQNKIVGYFQSLDHLITLHQRKCDELKKVKKFMLQKMFPKKGEKNPEIRFDGFTNDWEQRKVGDITKELSEYAKLNSGLPLLTSARTGLMYQSDYRGNSTTDNENTLFSIVPLNACTYRHMSDDSTFHINVNTLEKGLVSKEYPVFVENESDLRFVVQYINSSDSFTKFCTEQKKGGTRTRLYYKTLCEYKMLIPSLNEQHIIADYFDNLDHLITLHQRKCEELKNVKKYMLQNMFAKGE